ncbi:MAG: DUF1294 domain-containing protein [Clostridiales bacterium]|nr:DUF1294 domain-containing protein [Clostridiales bacterium]
MKDILIVIAIIYLLAMNVIGFAIMGIDKLKAMRRGWRIPERTLLLIAIIGGTFGSFLGMVIFRHKINKRKFQLLLPLVSLVYIIILWFLR